MRRPLVGAATIAALLALQTAVLAPLVDEDALLPVALAYLLVALIAAALWGWAVGLVSAVVANLLVNFFFIPPLHTFSVREPENVVALFLFLTVAAIGAAMLSLLQRQVVIARAARAESEILLSLSNETALAVSPRDAMNRLCEAITRALHATGCAILQPTGGWHVVASTGGLSQVPRDEEALPAQALRSRTIVTSPSNVPRAGRPFRPARERRLTYVPLPATAPEPGALRISGPLRPPPGVQLDRLLPAFAIEASLVLHRARLQEEALRSESLQRADELKTALLSSVSHDLRSPLMAIRASVESLGNSAMPWSKEDRDAFLATIDSQSARLSTTVDHLLAMSRLEGGAIQPLIESIPVVHLYDEIAAGAAGSLNGHALQSDVPDGLAFRGDWGLALQAVANLVENAAKYSTPGAPIRLGAQRSGPHVVLTVADEGPGIPQSDLPHVFEKFYRGSDRGEVRGSGLGLSIVKAMVELCGGQVAVDSTPVGTRFMLTLPAAASRP
jgi:two-component system sensor histidine kinase KdpD